MDMDTDDKDTRHDGEDLDDTEREIQSQAARGLGDVPSHLTPRRTSLDRSYTMPAPSWEEGDQILKVSDTFAVAR